MMYKKNLHTCLLSVLALLFLSACEKEKKISYDALDETNLYFKGKAQEKNARICQKKAEMNAIEKALKFASDSTKIKDAPRTPDNQEKKVEQKASVHGLELYDLKMEKKQDLFYCTATVKVPLEVFESLKKQSLVAKPK